MKLRTLHLIHAAVLLAWLAVAILVHPSLPERIPIHFSATGEADAWARTGTFSWLGLPLVAMGTALFLGLLGRAARRGSPELWNVPEKERFLRLTPEQRAPIEDRLERMIGICALLTSAMLLAIHVAVYETAVGRRTGLAWYAFAAMIGGTALMIVLAVTESRRIGPEIRRASDG